ncbi:MAG: phospho-sugar mutase, partial [Planctomycetota bacterium]
MTELDRQTALEQVKQAAEAGKITASAAKNIETWLTEDRYAEYAPEVVRLIAENAWQELDEAFWQVIPFGTGGRRGRMFPVGTNAINDRTIGESAQGVADYVKSVKPQGPWSCAIAYDTRHRSREFAELCAGIMAAAGFTVYFLDGHRSTPELSFAVRFKKCDCGIMVTASHNPPSDNAVKVYWSTGGQVLPPHDKRMIDRVMQVQDVSRLPFDEAVAAGKVIVCQEEVDAAYREAVAKQSRPGPRDLKILYSPLHGVGATAVLPALDAAGFKDVEVFGPHAEPNGDFPNVPDHVANPENPAVFDAIVERAKEVDADLILATDPDCDRVGCAAPLTPDDKNTWDVLTGNQIGALLTDYLLGELKSAGKLTPEHYVVETIVTSKLIGRIARAHSVRVIDDLMVGFKWIGGVMEYANYANALIQERSFWRHT